MKKILFAVLFLVLGCLISFVIFKITNNSSQEKITYSEQEYEKAVNLIEYYYSQDKKETGKETKICPNCNKMLLREIIFFSPTYAIYDVVNNSSFDGFLRGSVIVQTCKNQDCKFFKLSKSVEIGKDITTETLYLGKYRKLEEVWLEKNN